MEVKIEVHMNEQSMIDFMTHHIYTSVIGMVTVALGILNIGLTFAFLVKREYMQALLFAAFVLLIFLVFPWFIQKRVGESFRASDKQREPAVYTFTDEGIMVEKSEATGLIPWTEFSKAIKKKRILILYRQNKKGVVFPLEQMDEQYNEAVKMICEHMPAPKVRIPAVKER